MGKKTEISWTDATWNPVRGCSRVSAGCDNCYAMGQAHRFAGAGKPFEGLTTIRRGKVDWTGIARFIPDQLSAPLSWRKPQRVFVNSMSDLFHESLSNEEIAAVFGVMAACPQHTFQVLTKRPKRAAEWFKVGEELTVTAGERLAAENGWCHAHEGEAWPLPNVWLGVSAEDQETYSARVPTLVHQCPAAVHFVSLEPMLGPIKLRGTGHIHLDWVIVGGESGPGARHFNVAWADALVADCAENGIATFVKQLGSCPVVDATWWCSSAGHTSGWRSGLRSASQGQALREAGLVRIELTDRKGGDMSEWDPGLRVREFPR